MRTDQLTYDSRSHSHIPLPSNVNIRNSSRYMGHLGIITQRFRGLMTFRSLLNLLLSGVSLSSHTSDCHFE
jgi:hypothetical protein